MASRQSKRKQPKREDKQVVIKFKTESEVFDRPTLMSLGNMIEKGIFDTLDYPVSTGKEANVYRASTKDGFVAVKIFRNHPTVLKRVKTYIEGDERFKGIGNNAFAILRAWARKEYKNLQVMQEAGCRVPAPIYCDRNILVMEFIGNAGVAYSTLRETGSETPQEDFDSLISDMGKIYRAGLVHADLSEFNIMMDDSGPRIIDCGQAVTLNHPEAETFLRRDVENLLHYFKKYGVNEDAEECIKRIKGR